MSFERRYHILRKEHSFEVMNELPYYAVIFTSTRTELDEGYHETHDLLLNKAKDLPGFLGLETAQEEIGITISYWRSLNDIKGWKEDMDHLIAQSRGRQEWYKEYRVRIARVERDYEFHKET